MLGGWANIANELRHQTLSFQPDQLGYAALPDSDEGELPFTNGDYLFIPGIRELIAKGASEIPAYVVKDQKLQPFTLQMGELTDDEKDIILKGCLINYYRG